MVLLAILITESLCIKFIPLYPVCYHQGTRLFYYLRTWIFGVVVLGVDFCTDFSPLYLLHYILFNALHRSNALLHFMRQMRRWALLLEVGSRVKCQAGVGTVVVLELGMGWRCASDGGRALDVMGHYWS